MPRSPRPARWIALRKGVQYIALLLFVAAFVVARHSQASPSLVDLPFGLDPLTVVANMLATRTARAASVLVLLTVALTLAFGRAWCGWLCPLGTLLDVINLRRWRPRRDAPPESWRGAKYVLLGTIVIAALLGNLSLLILDPLTIVFRTLGTSVWPAVDAGVTAAERAAYALPALRPGVDAIDAILRPWILPSEGLVSRGGAALLVFFLGLVGLNLVAERFWCRYLCPLAGLLGLGSKLAWVQRRVGDACRGCDLCARACPTDTIRPEAGFASDPAECTVCLECLEACPRGDVHFPLRLPRPSRQAYDPDRRQLLLSLGAAAVGASLIQLDQRLWGSPDLPLRPPGVSETDLLSSCVRCGACVRACPTGALQPALLDAGLEGFWSPVLIPRLGYCSYACHACGQICPVEAIPALALEEKRQAVIGRACIDRDRCIAWAEDLDCIVCEEMCPLPRKAVILEHFAGRGRGAGRVRVKRPHVIEERCIGCGICEFKCPVEGEAAIRVASTPLDHAGRGRGWGAARGEP